MINVPSETWQRQILRWYSELGLAGHVHARDPALQLDLSNSKGSSCVRTQHIWPRASNGLLSQGLCNGRVAN